MTAAYLEFCPQPRNHPPEDLYAQLEHLGHRANSIATQAQTEILVDRLDEACGIIARVRVDYRIGGHDKRHVGIQDGEYQVEGQQL